ncbi:hypothetical protein [Aestuariimicrobium ganziense]|nr:hypothetical protein [Aestuariimicrobium ganziense]
MSWVKKVVWTLVVAFALFYVFTQPEQTAAAIRGFFSGLIRLFRALAG